MDHQSLVGLIWVLHVATNRTRVERLPSILLAAALDLPMRPNLHHAVDQSLIELILLVSRILRRATRDEVLLSLSILLRYQTHRQLPNIN